MDVIREQGDRCRRGNGKLALVALAPAEEMCDRQGQLCSCRLRGKFSAALKGVSVIVMKFMR